MTRTPPLTLLTPTPARDTASDVDHGATLRRVALEHGVELNVTGSQRGCAVTRYLVTPGTGVLPKRVQALTEAFSVGTGSEVRYAGRVGAALAIEVPNETRDVVGLRSLIEGGQALVSLGIVVGQDVGGQTVTGRLADLPHLLVAGTTGSGKSGLLNAALVSLILTNTPDDLALVLIDPKRVELTAYAALPHLSRPVVTDVSEAAQVLTDVADEMDSRYSEMSAAGVKDISAWNDRAGADRWARKVVVIDELADLMMTAGKVVEKLIARIGAVGRAAGIHLIVATQRPSADVVTGLIKANIPSRLALTTASAVDSRVIGVAGAEKLTGRGDGLWSPAGVSEPERVQVPWVDEDEIARVVAWWVKQGNSARVQDEIYARLRAQREGIRQQDLANLAEQEQADLAAATAEARGVLSSGRPRHEVVERIRAQHKAEIHYDSRLAAVEQKNTELSDELATAKALIAQMTAMIEGGTL